MFFYFFNLLSTQRFLNVGTFRNSVFIFSKASFSSFVLCRAPARARSNVFIFLNLYPDEPKATSSDTLTISNSGKMVNNETVKSKRKLGNGNTEIITELLGKDGNDNKPALIRTTYTVGKNIYTNIKM